MVAVTGTDETVTQAGGLLNSADDEEMLAMARKRWRIVKAHWAEWRREATEAYAFVAGEQWDFVDVNQLKAELRVPVTFNRIEPMIDVVVGTEIGNRQQVRYIGRSLEDSAVNEVYSAAADFYRDESEAEHEDTDAFRDALICGLGATEVRLDFEEDPTGNIVIDRVDPLELWIDADTKKNNAADMRYLFRVREVPYSDVKATWPEEAKDVYAMRHKSGWDADIEGEGDDAIHVDISGDQYDGEGGGVDRGFNDDSMLRLVEYQYTTKVPVFLVPGEDGSLKKISQKNFGDLRMTAKAAGFSISEGEDYFRAHQRVVKRAFIIGRKVMQHDIAPCVSHFSYPIITGKRDRNNHTWYGIVRSMMDPQRWANKFFSQILHIVNTSAKSGLYAEIDATDDERELERKFAKTGSLIWLAPGGLNKVRERGFGNYPAGIDKLMEFSIHSLRDVTGINLELLGLAGKDQAGVLEYQRKQAGLTILGFLFDNLRRYRKKQGEILLYFIENYVSDGRLIRIMGPEGQKYVPLTKQEGVTKYDVVIDEAPDSPNQKERVFQVLMQIIPAMVKMGYPVPPQVVEYLPLPTTLIESFKEFGKMQQQKPDPEAIKAQVEAQQKQVDVQLEQQKMQFEQQMKMQELQMRQQEQQQKMQLEIEKERMKMQMERSRLELEREKVQAEIQANALKASVQAQIDRMLAEVKADNERMLADIKRETMQLETEQKIEDMDEITDAKIENMKEEKSARSDDVEQSEEGE